MHLPPHIVFFFGPRVNALSPWVTLVDVHVEHEISSKRSAYLGVLVWSQNSPQTRYALH